MNHQEHQGHQEVGARLDDIGRSVVDAGLKVHRWPGAGLLESAHDHCLVHELSSRRLTVQRQVTLPIVYDGVTLDAGYRLDLVVEAAINVEVKSVDALNTLQEAQVLTYLRLSGYRLAVLINFDVPPFKQGVRRFVV